MCGRYVSRAEAAEERAWEIHRSPGVEWVTSYNVAPTEQVPIVRLSADGERELVLAKWWLIPDYAKGEPLKGRGGKGRLATFNARAESMKSSGVYRGAWGRGQRCIFAVSGFYEWQMLEDGKSKQAWYIHLADQEIFGLAGLWDRSVKSDGTTVASCTIVTVPANSFMADIHNTRKRMPVILSERAYDDWLAGDAKSAEQWVVPFAGNTLTAYKVSSYVNNARNKDARCIEPMVA